MIDCMFEAVRTNLERQQGVGQPKYTHQIQIMKTALLTSTILKQDITLTLTTSKF